MESNSSPKKNYHHTPTKFEKLRSAMDQEVYKKWEESAFNNTFIILIPYLENKSF